MKLQIKLLSSRVNSPNNVKAFSLLYKGVVFPNVFIFCTDEFQIFLFPHLERKKILTKLTLWNQSNKNCFVWIHFWIKVAETVWTKKHSKSVFCEFGFILVWNSFEILKKMVIYNFAKLTKNSFIIHLFRFRGMRKT